MRLYIFIFILLLERFSAKKPGSNKETNCRTFLGMEPQTLNCSFSSSGKNVYLAQCEAIEGFVLKMDTIVVMQDDSVFMSKCMSVQHILSRSIEVVNNTHPQLLNLTLLPYQDNKQSAVINVSKACYGTKRSLDACDAVLLLSRKASLPLLSNSPLQEQFWIRLHDDPFPPDWKYSLEIITESSSNRSILSKWIAHMRLAGLKKLNLQGNIWGQLVLNLPYLPNLEDLNLSNNNVTSIPHGFFNNTPQIKNLVLSNNLSFLPVKVFSSLRSLTNLNLQSNSFTNCSENALQYIDSLNELDFSKNKIMILESHCFSTLYNLKTLNVAYNELSSIETSTFENLKHLQYLNLSHNKLFAINFNFQNYKYFQELSLSYNNIIQEPVLGNVTVQTLDLSNNRLTSIVNMTTPMKRITLLDLSSNNISNLYTKGVGMLNLSYNNLETLSTTILENISRSSFDYIDLGGNSFNCCNSNTPVFQQWLRKERQRVRYLNRSDSPSCVLTEPSYKYSLLSVQYDEQLCLGKKISWSLATALGVPLGLLAALVVTTVLFLYCRRAELSYTHHLFRMKRKARGVDEQNSELCKYDAFVCYSGKNFLWVSQQLLPSLENGPESYRLCLHDRDFTIGAAIDSNIVAAMEKSRKVIIVLSSDFVSSRWCQWELEMANHKTFEHNRDYIILVELERLDHSKLPSNLRYLMATRTYLEWPQEESEECKVQRAWRRLRDALGESIFQQTGVVSQCSTVLYS